MLNIRKFMRVLSSRLLNPAVISVFLIICFLSVASAASSKGVYHTVKKGETLWRISSTYGVSAKEVSRINKIRNSERIRVGQKIYIPGRTKIRKVAKKSAAASVKKHKTRKIVKHKKKRVVKGRFAWPVKGRVVNRFGVQGGTSLDGIDIIARKGASVKAADGGEVVHATNDMRVFGNIIILKHKGDYYTLYAHNDKNLVKTGDRVKKGEKIAMVGNSGGADRYKLHFELRDGRDVKDPLLFLP